MDDDLDADFADESDARVACVASELRAIYADAFWTGGVVASTAVLARRLGVHKRTIERAHELIRLTYGERFVEWDRWSGLSLVAPRRYITPGGHGRSDVPLNGYVEDLEAGPPHARGVIEKRRTGSLSEKADRARAHAFRTKHRRVEPPRRRATPTPAVPHPGRHVAPYEVEPGVAAAIEAHYGPERGPRVVEALQAELDSYRRGDYAGRPVETGRALRTLPLRPLADTPVGYFRSLFSDACAGDLLCDKREDAARVRDAETAAALEHDAPFDLADADERVPGGQNMSADELVAAAADRMRQRSAAEIYHRGIPWWERPEPSAESKRFGVVLAHLRQLPDDDPARAGLQREAMLLYQRGVRPPDRDTGPPPEKPP